ncbi:hypothetical protein [Spirosoma rigui]|uniref:hypothetical protein n=1 Tax=Spirosoma rigui TaxID=564064 RepID=UPI0009AF6F5E|nr:hypothetical protein [Spirosoma rigui]
MEVNAKTIALALILGGLIIPRSQAQTSAIGAGSQPTAAASNVTPPEGPGAPGLDGPGPEGSGPDGPGGPGPQRRPGQHPGGKGGHMGEGRPGGPESGLTSLTTVSGTVGQLTASDDFVFDGFVLNTTGKSSAAGSATTVKFPPHLGQQVQQSIKSGSSVRVTGFSETSPAGESIFRMTSLTAGKSTVVDTPPALPAPETTAPALVTETGKVADYRLGRDGRVNGFVLDNRTVVRVPPHVAFQLTNLAKKGSTMTVQGYPLPLRTGQVQLEKTNVLRASVLTINGQQYLVR